MARPRSINKILIENDEVSYLYCKHGIVIVDTKSLDLIRSYKWFTKLSVNGTYYVYASDTKDGKEYKLLLHRLLLNAPKGYVVDHINRNTLDNRLCNLRLCTKAENNRNCKKNKRGTSSKYKGVTKRPSGRFGVYIQHNKKSICLGTYDSEQEAAEVYNKKALEFFGDYANINSIGESDE